MITLDLPSGFLTIQWCVSKTVLNFLFGPHNYQQHHNTLISKFYKNVESFVVSLIEGWDTAEPSTMRKLPYHDSSFSLEVPLLFQTKNICDWNKQNEFEVEKYDFGFFGIFYKGIV